MIKGEGGGGDTNEPNAQWIGFVNPSIIVRNEE